MSQRIPAGRRLVLGIRRLGKSFYYASCGVSRSVYTERNLRIHLTMLVLVTEFGILYGLARMEWMVLCILFGLMLMAELWNTAIEALADLATRRENALVRISKDTAAGAVLMMAAMSVVVGVLLFSDGERLRQVWTTLCSHPVLFVVLLVECLAAVWFIFLYGAFRESDCPYRKKKENKDGK